MGRRKLIWSYKKKDIEFELSKYDKNTIETYRGSIKDKTNGDLKQIKEIVDQEESLLFYRLVALKIYKELGGK